MTGAAPLLETVGISKQYPGVLAPRAAPARGRSPPRNRRDQQAVSRRARARPRRLHAPPGEVHVLFGENGAGKSTLISILAGVQRPTAAKSASAAGRSTSNSVHQARSLGISAVFQEFSLVPQMTVEENLFLGAEILRGGVLDKRAIRARAREIIARLGFPLRPEAPRRAAHPRRAADGRDRQGVPLRALGADPRRADRVAHRPRDRAALRAHRPGQGRRASASSTSPTACRRSAGSATASRCSATAATSPPSTPRPRATTSWSG